LCVHALCWPIVPAAWRLLAESWEWIGGSRDVLDAPAKPTATSWIADCAPQAGAPFRGSPAEESTLAAIITRTPMLVAISIIEGAQGARENQREGLLNCLTAYNAYVRQPGHAPGNVLLSSRTTAAAADHPYADALSHCRQRLPEVKWLQEMESSSWHGIAEPLPLEFAHIAASSVIRYHANRDAANPIARAVRAKLAQPVALLDAPPAKRRPSFRGL
jgi:hypothetical protein